MDDQALPSSPTVAFVLGGGGNIGSYEVGMLRALLERGIRPDLVVGASVGAVNGVAVAADPTVEMIEKLADVWRELESHDLFSGSLLNRAVNLLRTGSHVHSNEPLRALIEGMVPPRFEDLAVPFQCVASSVEQAAEHWFSSGSVVEAVLASAASPGLLPVVEIDGEHFLDGGIVNSIPISRAVELGASELYVLHVGRVERPLEPPTNVWEVAMVTFELSRRHRFHHDLASLPDGVVAHVLPTGETDPPRFDVLDRMRYRDFTDAERRMELAYEASCEVLDAEQLAGG
ncbi:MAG: patatin-like phospholipase family protein [Actinomycetota bacterium]|nr:patatin-like phospholipase family protein [Actinomycetota bacterium]